MSRTLECERVRRCMNFSSAESTQLAISSNQTWLSEEVREVEAGAEGAEDSLLFEMKMGWH
jgi:hypothetical protein